MEPAKVIRVIKEWMGVSVLLVFSHIGIISGEMQEVLLVVIVMEMVLFLVQDVKIKKVDMNQVK
jgi:hypothetical protein